ncbi:MAG: hypothetical protein Q8Q69_00110 [Nitrosopumilaceae archaeon]|nr:hypothetical protein [Nitrosopumilaceae archaeon]
MYSSIDDALPKQCGKRRLQLEDTTNGIVENDNNTADELNPEMNKITETTQNYKDTGLLYVFTTRW